MIPKSIQNRQSQRPRRVVPTLESLEQRCLLSTTIYESEPNNTMAMADPLPLGFDAKEDTELVVRGSISAVGDDDWYAVNLNAGDVIGATVMGNNGLNPTISLIRSDDTLLWFNDDNDGYLAASYFMAKESPLPRLSSYYSTDSIMQYVIDAPGTYYIEVAAANDASAGGYKMNLVVARPGMESQPAGATQILYVDFDGATVNLGQFAFGSGTKRLSPLRDFLSGWGLSASDENDVIDVVLETIAENYLQDISARGENGYFADSGIPGEFNLQILNSRDHPEFDDQFGQHPYMSRVVVGGSTQETGVETVAFAQGVDVGNFLFTDDAIVMLDWLSAPVGVHGATLNRWGVHPSSSKAELVGTAIGVLASHEAGHNFGNLHTDTFDITPMVANIMDHRPLSVVAGEDGIFGNHDDPDIDFGVDAFLPGDWSGQVDTLNWMAFALSTGKVAPALQAESVGSNSTAQGLSFAQVSPLLEVALNGWQGQNDSSYDYSTLYYWCPGKINHQGKCVGPGHKPPYKA